LSTGEISSGAGFRRMQDLIMHEGIALRLDAWTMELQRRDQTCTTLDDFAASCPTKESITELSDYLAGNYVSGGQESTDIFVLHTGTPAAQQDYQCENILLMHKYFLLYEEMSYTMNQGDIGRLETLFPPWISIFRGTGKHKYASHMAKFLSDVHFVYPLKLWHAVHYNLLVNPTGLPGKFCGVDWVEESMINLYTKHTFGGSGPNYTQKRVIEESTLIKIFHDCHNNIERNFCLTSITSKHGLPNLSKSLEMVKIYTEKYKPNVHQPGRKAIYKVSDVMDLGQHIIFNLGGAVGDLEEKVNQAVEEDDLATELCSW
ncbi:hypothetical protein K443DRAFT_115398, partial [Laccaria amethystina LaAM-08-1]